MTDKELSKGLVGMEELTTEGTLPRIVARVVEDMCDNYCKFPNQYGDSDEQIEKLWENHCNNCPLNKLI